MYTVLIHMMIFRSENSHENAIRGVFKSGYYGT